MPKVLIPTPLRQFTGKHDAVQIPGATVGEVLKTLTERYPDLRKQIFTDEGKVRSFVNVYLNDEDVRYLGKDSTAAAEADTISLVPSIAGGSGATALAGEGVLTGISDTPPSDVAHALMRAVSRLFSTRLRGGDRASRTSVGVGADAARMSACATSGSPTSFEKAALTNDEILRYSRHLIIPEVGVEGQQRLKDAKVLLIGAGGLGAPLGLYLAAAGIGRLGLVDFDVVDFTNLQRQVIHSTADVGRKKIDSAAEKMTAINPNVTVVKHETALTSENALDILKNYDIVVDGTDNFPTRYLVNDACVLLGKPNVYGSIFRFEGQSTVFAYKGGPCYRCLYPEPPPPGLVPSCAEGGVLGILPGTIGLIQATETVKLILGIGEPLVGRLLLYDALGMRFRELKLRKNPECPVCGERPTITRLIDYHQFCGVPNPRSAAREPETKLNPGEIEVTEVKRKLDRGDDFLLIDVREPNEYKIASIPGARLIPLGEFAKHVGELEPAAEIVIHCKSGMRSAKACGILRNAGFTNVRNMKGGILAWSSQVDPSVPKY